MKCHLSSTSYTPNSVLSTFTRYFVLIFSIVLRSKCYSSHYLDKQTETKKLYDLAKAVLLVASRARIKIKFDISDSNLDEGLFNKSAGDPKWRGEGNMLSD